MKPKIVTTLCTVAALLIATGCTAQQKELELKSDSDKASYSIGMNLGRDFKSKGIEIDADILARGIQDVMADGKVLLTEEEAQQTLMALQQQMMAKQEALAKEATEKNKAEGAAFLAENAKKEGIKTLKSGLQYKILEEGSGRIPTASDKVTVNYKGTLIDGTEFDSSYKRGQPATFPVGGVIAGWTEALQLMKEGAKWQLFIPADLAYGERGAGPVIGPNATLIFDVELISIEK